MNKFKKIVFVFLVLLLTAGCGAKEEAETNYTEVKDETIINVIKGHVVNIETLPKTIELYKKDSFQASDYSNDDLLQFGLNSSFGQETNIDLTPAQINNLKAKNITNVSSYLTIDNVEDAIKDTFGAKSVTYADKINGCPSYIYDASESVYYVNETCTVNEERVVSYISNISYDNNLYYATVYVGLVSNNKIYGDVNKAKAVADLAPEQSYVIDDDNKESFTKYTYTFTKNSDGKYVFTSVEK